MCGSEHDKMICCCDKCQAELLEVRDAHQGICRQSGKHSSKRRPGIVTVNRQMHNECVSILQKITEFRFGTQPCLRSFVENLSDSHRSLITKLSLRTLLKPRHIWSRGYIYRANGPLAIFVSKTMASRKYLSQSGWSRDLATSEFFDLRDKDIVFTLSITKTSEEGRHKNFEERLCKGDCQIIFGKFIVHGFPDDKRDCSNLDEEWVLVYRLHDPSIGLSSK